MIRKVYLDFIKSKAMKGNIGWIIKRAWQYFLIHLSYLIKKPLCGPILGTFLTNYRCNYRCMMCDFPLRYESSKKEGSKELSTSEAKQVLKEFSELGVSGIGFTGGEPLLRSDIFELLNYTKNLGMITHLNTNGYFLDLEKSKQAIASGIDSINISLDGATATTHDTIRGFQGAFDKTIHAIKNILSQREIMNSPVRLKIVAVLNEKNIDEVPGLIQLVKDLKIDCIEFIPEQPFFGSSAVSRSPYDEKFFEKLKEMTSLITKCQKDGVKIENSPRHIALFEDSFKGKKSPLQCYAGYNSLAVDCYGEIYPCMPWINWEKGVGNIKNMPLKNFWYSQKYNKGRIDVSQCHDCYLNCQAELNLLFNILRF